MFSIGFNVTESISINRDVADVYASVANFNDWPKWSPWLCQEPDAEVSVEGEPGAVGQRQEWLGTFIGAGNMTLAAANENTSLDYELNFLKPWKSRAEVGFRFAPADGGTRVEWWMKGNLPFFLFFMKSKMAGFVGGDYQRGLKMLKELLEEGSVPTATAVQGVVDRPAVHYIGKARSCTMDEIGPLMRQDLTEMAEKVNSSELPQPANVFSIYRDFDMVKGTCSYTTGFTYTSAPPAVEGLETGEIPDHKALQVNHTGPYRHVGNAGAAAMGAPRANHKTDKSIPMYEVYVSDPHEVAENDLETEVFVPVRK